MPQADWMTFLGVTEVDTSASMATAIANASAEKLQAVGMALGLGAAATRDQIVRLVIYGGPPTNPVLMSAATVRAQMGKGPTWLPS